MLSRQSWGPQEIRSVPDDRVGDQDRAFQVGAVNWFFSPYEFPAELYMRYAYARLDQKAHRRWPCLWVTVLTIIHLVESSVDLAEKPWITVRDLALAEVLAHSNIYAPAEWAAAHLDYSLRRHINILGRYFGERISLYCISLLAPALNQEYFLAGNKDSPLLIQFICFAGHIALAREEITPQLAMRERRALKMGAGRPNFMLTPLSKRVMMAKSE